MKVVYCIQDNFRVGGMERVLANKANYLASHGFEVCIITTDQQGKASYFSLDKNVRCYDLGINYFSASSRWQYLHCIVEHKKKLNKLLRELNANIVISMFDQETEFLPSIHDGSKKILELHYNYFIAMPRLKGIRGLYHHYKNRKRAANIKKYDRFVVLTHEDREAWVNFKNIDVIPNCQTFECEYPATLDCKRVLAVGRYHSQKAFDRLIEAWSLVNRSAKDWTLHIIGEGALRESLQMQINYLGLSQSIFLDGVSSNIKKEYLNASILSMSSLYEGLPMILIEAMTCGLPVVSFACPCGPRDLITDGENGFLVENGDIEGLADRLLYLITRSDERKRMGKNAFESAKEYSEDKVMSKWINLFNELCQ